jgi:hypothetical protein
MKTLNTIQKLSSIGKVISKIVFIVCIVSFCLCILALIGLALNFDGLIKIRGVTIHGLISEEIGVEKTSLAIAVVGVMIIIVGEAVVSRFAVGYFSKELEEGTPFSRLASDELMKLGILTIAVPIAGSIVAAIVMGIICGIMDIEEASELVKYEGGGNISLGLMFIIGSLLCRYGAELNENKDTNRS